MLILVIIKWYKALPQKEAGVLEHQYCQPKKQIGLSVFITAKENRDKFEPAIRIRISDLRVQLRKKRPKDSVRKEATERVKVAEKGSFSFLSYQKELEVFGDIAEKAVGQAIKFQGKELPAI
ncbi:hypothetical protein LOAG_03913 [Loa loa]|uniref:Uncharacterized protein n=1 Tax=Loa loa TaxID=7209 RepID=A0A1S0U3J6_LOALO|nr:hypothetical protein LOAG_03913 [Loa loa]EFO24576.1 hypothetical protein LOAG_03913 [Loa loa]